MKYEIRKLWVNKIILIGILVLMIISINYGYKIVYSIVQSNIDLADDIYKGEYTLEKFEMLSQEFEIQKQSGEDFTIIGETLSRARACKDILEYRERVLKSASKLKKSSDVYIARTNSRIEEIYSEDIKLDIIETRKFDNVMILMRWQETEDIITIIIIIFAASYIFTLEHGANTHKLVFSSRGGRTKTYIRKLSCIAGLAFLLPFITNICMCLYAVTSGDEYIWSLPVQYYGEFMKAPYVMSLLEFVIISTLIKSMGLIVIGICSAVISLLFKKSIIPVIVSTVIMVGCYLLCSYYGDYSPLGTSVIQSKYEAYTIFKQYSCIGLFNNSGYYMKQYMPINVFDYPVDMVYFNLGINLVFVMAVVFAGYLVYRKRDV